VTQALDTNVLIRHLTGDPPDQASRASAYLAAAQPRSLLLLDLHLAETVFVLEGPYRRSRKQVATVLLAVLGLPAIEVENARRIARAVELYAGSAFDFADAYLVAAAEELGVADVVSFDRFDAKLRRASAVRRREP
jgi:predicted nucleic-acid-binding protein